MFYIFVLYLDMSNVLYLDMSNVLYLDMSNMLYLDMSNVLHLDMKLCNGGPGYGPIYTSSPVYGVDGKVIEDPPLHISYQVTRVVLNKAKQYVLKNDIFMLKRGLDS